MSAMLDYISGKKSGREAELEASLEHTAGHLGVELEEAGKLRAEIERLAAENEKLRLDIKDAMELLSDTDLHGEDRAGNALLCLGQALGTHEQ